MRALTEAHPARFEPIPDTLRSAVALTEGGARHEVDGIIVEGAWRCGEEMLLATTDDIPSEDTLHLTLLGDGGPVDVVHLGAAYATGAFKALSVEGASLSFRYFGGTVWRVEVLPSATFTLPFIGLPRGARRDAAFAKRLDLKGDPQPGR